MQKFAECGGIKVEELKVLEWEFCEIVGYWFLVSEETENDYVRAILKYARKERERLKS